MKPRDMAELAGRNLREALLRNSLTTLGIAVGGASLVAMLSLGAGLKHFASSRLSHSGLFNSILVTRKIDFRGLRRLAHTPAKPPQPSRPLDSAALAALRRLPHVTEVYNQVRFINEVNYDGHPYTTAIAGVPNLARHNDAFTGMKGRYFSGPQAREAILEDSFAKQLTAHPHRLLGQELDLRYARREPLPAAPGSDASGFAIVPQVERLRIVGIIFSQPVFGFSGFMPGRVFIPQSLAERLQVAEVSDLRNVVQGAGAGRNYSSLTVNLQSASDVPAAEAAIRGMGFRTFSLQDASRRLALVFAIFDLLLGVFGSLALAVASLGIINTLVMAILERRREIGVLKALGAGELEIKKLFLMEAGVMGLAGGIAGVILGWALGRGLNWGTAIYLNRRNLPAVEVSMVPWWLALGAIGFAIFISLLAGLYPAARAARLDPIKALRYE